MVAQHTWHEVKRQIKGNAYRLLKCAHCKCGKVINRNTFQTYYLIKDGESPIQSMPECRQW